MKRLLAFVLLAALGTVAHGGEWLRIDIIVCEDPPAAIEFAGLFIEVSVWDEKDPGGMVKTGRHVQMATGTRPTSGIYYCDNFLPGVIDEWNAWIWPGKKRTYGYDGKWYQIKWKDVKAFHNKASNYSTMHLDFEWRIDPDQSAKPDESLPARRAQWWW